MESSTDPEGQLPHLATFATAAETGSFTAAGQTLRLTQAAISQRIQALERNLGLALFRREAGHVLLTEVGQRLYGYAQRILSLHREAREAVTGDKPPIIGELSLAASSVPGEHLLPVALSVFGQKYPHVQVRATVTDSRTVLHQVEHGQAHVGLLGMKEENAHLEFRGFARDRLVLVVPQQHPWARKRRVTLKQLLGQPLIVREAGSGSRSCLEQALAQAGYPPHKLRVALVLGSNEAIKEAVVRGIGAAVLSTRVVEKAVQEGLLHAVEVTGLSLEREMFVVRDRRRVLPIPAQLFLDSLQSCADMSCRP
jgi:LysR family transcriptional regulator, low CO2-responsive transcriptional regulator